MKNIIIPFLCVVLSSTSVVAQVNSTTTVKKEAIKSNLTSQQVINNYIKALGGKDKLEAVKSLITENKIHLEGMEVSTIKKKMGNKFITVSFVNGQQMTQFFDGEKGYFDKMGQKDDFSADKIIELKKGRTIDALGYDVSKFKTITIENLDNKDYNVLQSDKGKYYFDAVTGLLYKSITDKITGTIKNYIIVDGLKFPEELETQAMGNIVTIKTTKIVLNSGVSDADFK